METGDTDRTHQWVGLDCLCKKSSHMLDGEKKFYLWNSTVVTIHKKLRDLEEPTHEEYDLLRGKNDSLQTESVKTESVDQDQGCLDHVHED